MEQNTNTEKTIMSGVGSKQRNESGLKVVTAIASIAAVCGIGFGIYGMMQSSQKENQISDLEVQVNNFNSRINTLETERSNITNGSNKVSTENNTETEKCITAPVEHTSGSTTDTTIDSYQTFSDNLAKNYANSVFGYYYHYNGSENIKMTMVAQIKNSHLTINDVDNQSAVIAEADGIISAYFVEVGNGGVPYFYLIKKDGSVARINISENGPRKIENLNGYAKIVSVFGGSDLKAHLVDINGNLYENY